MQVYIGTTIQPPVNYQYDYADKLTSVSQNGLTTTKVYGDPAGRLSSVTLPNGGGGFVWLRPELQRDFADLQDGGGTIWEL